MTTTDQHPHDGDASASWEHVGRAAEHFARRVARDASKFAERIQEHAGGFAEDMSRDWRRARREYGRGCRRASRYAAATAPDVRRVFEDIRAVLADVLDGVDELITGMFGGVAEQGDGVWVRVVHNRDTTCAGCQRPIAAGDEGFVRRGAGGMEFRCAECETRTS
jgi:hypothetical protein